MENPLDRNPFASRRYKLIIERKQNRIISLHSPILFLPAAIPAKLGEQVFFQDSIKGFFVIRLIEDIDKAIKCLAGQLKTVYHLLDIRHIEILEHH